MLFLLSNTGNVSFWLYGIFILITVVAMFVAFRQIIKGTIPPEKLDKMIDIFKYAVVSTAIATTTLIVTNLFKEREQDIKELEYFDKYAGDVKLAENILVRKQLSKYFSIVAPDGDMKRSWKNYYDSVLVEYDAYLKVKGADSQNAKKQLIIEAAESPLATAASITLRPSDRFVVNTTPDITNAGDLERVGFQALQRKDYAEAAAAFTKSENAKNGFHASYELARLLRSNSAAMKKDKNVELEILTEIKKEYSGYAPAEVRAWLEEQAKTGMQKPTD